ncbi:MAG: tRNA1(Val) (adenine(37)-N6)-methyltransferase [Bacilli bacterium]
MDVVNYLLGYDNVKIYQNSSMFNFSLDSILLANFVKVNKKSKRILDIGCGNGVMPLILATKYDCKIDAIEIQEEACILAKKSVEINNLNDKINIINEDIKLYTDTCESDTYDIIVCNPPYFKVNEVSKKNDSKYKIIARHEVNLNVEDVIKVSKKLLKNNGNLAIVHRPERLIEIICLMKENNIEPKKIQFVYPKKNKESNILLIEGCKNGNPGIKILPPIFAHAEDGEYTQEIKKYFS